MCARLTITTTAAEIADLFGLGHDLRNPQPGGGRGGNLGEVPPQKPGGGRGGNLGEVPPQKPGGGRGGNLGEVPPQKPGPKRRYNVTPSTVIPVVRMSNGTPELTELRWGLIPHWNTDPKPVGYVNARAETAPEKPAFRDPFRHRRCLVPTDGFFEWKTVGKKKKPYYVRPVGGGLFVYAGVWDRWTGPHGPVETVAVLTVPANELVRPLHDRMPAIVPHDQFAAWLDAKESRPAKLLPLLTPYPAERMEMWPVSDRVNAVATDDPDLLVPVAEPPPPTWTQPTLFDVA